MGEPRSLKRLLRETVTVVNTARETFAGKRFHLFYVSNDEAIRTVIKASNAVEPFLYPNSTFMDSKKQVTRIILKLAGSNSVDEVSVVESEDLDHEFVVTICPSIMEGPNFRHDVSLAIQQGVARVRLYNGGGGSPKYLIDGIVEYITTSDLSGEAAPLWKGLGFGACWKRNDRRAVAAFLRHCESRRPGFVARLNQIMRYDWRDDMFGIALGVPVQDLCTSFESFGYNFFSL